MQESVTSPEAGGRWEERSGGGGHHVGAHGLHGMEPWNGRGEQRKQKRGVVKGWFD